MQYGPSSKKESKWLCIEDHQRYAGTTVRERRMATKAKRIVIAIGPVIANMPIGVIRNGLVFWTLNLIQLIRSTNRIVNVPTPIFFNRRRTAATFSSASLYDMRITSRNHIPILIGALFQNPNAASYALNQRYAGTTVRERRMATK